MDRFQNAITICGRDLRNCHGIILENDYGPWRHFLECVRDFYGPFSKCSYNLRKRFSGKETRVVHLKTFRRCLQTLFGVHCLASVVEKRKHRSSWCEMAGNATDATISDLSPNIPYMACEVLVAVCAVIGNALVILVFHRERRLRRRTNYYIISLAIADLLVGLLGIPFAILASMGLPTNLHACLFTVSLLVVLCTISIFCLVAVSVDRYWAILHPMGYSRNVRTKTAIGECVQLFAKETADHNLLEIQIRKKWPARTYTEDLLPCPQMPIWPYLETVECIPQLHAPWFISVPFRPASVF
jgi:adenosine receptor A2a